MNKEQAQGILEHALWDVKRQSTTAHSDEDVLEMWGLCRADALSSLQRDVLEGVDAAIANLEEDDSVGSLRPEALHILRVLREECLSRAEGSEEST